MGPEFDGIHPVDNEYSSYFVLLTRAFDRHRVSLRYDDFEVTETDPVVLDENAEDGDAWTLAYRFQLNNKFGIAAEWLQIHSERPAWAYNNLETSQTEKQLQLSFELRVGNR
jgi:phosphate-selective porin